MISHSVDVGCVGLGPSTNLLMSLKQHVVELASNIGVLNTIQSAAQATLQAGWSILLPTADERAKTLSALLPSTGNTSVMDMQVYAVKMYQSTKLRHSFTDTMYRFTQMQDHCTSE
jgi:hypothetical protein